MSAPASRRGFLKGIAIFSAGTAVAGTAIAAEMPDAPLVALGAEIDREFARYRSLRAALDQAVSRFEAIEPPIPDGLKMEGWNGWLNTEWPPDHFGRPNASRAAHKVRIPCARDLARKVAEVDGRTAVGRNARRLKRLSDAFHRAHEAARDEVGINAAERACSEGGWAVKGISDQIDKLPATTLAGLVVKGRAGLAVTRVNQDERRVWQSAGIVALYENLAALGGAA